jgi:enhancer of polycomb-like protein
MSTRSTTAGRHVRQRKLNTKQPLRILREGELEETFDDEAQRQIQQVETGVEKGEEIVSSLATYLALPYLLTRL